VLHRSGESATQGGPSEAIVTNEDFLNDLGRAYQIWLPQFTNSAFDVVLSPNNLRLINNRELRSGLITARRSIEEIFVSRDVLGSEYSERRGPFLASVGILSGLGWHEIQEDEFQLGIFRPLPTPPFDSVYAALLTS
jgi:hypothetical protein